MTPNIVLVLCQIYIDGDKWRTLSDAPQHARFVSGRVCALNCLCEPSVPGAGSPIYHGKIWTLPPAGIAHTPYVNELARVLRYPGLRLPKERYPSELSLHAIFRPLYGFGSCHEVLASQRTIRKMLVDLLAADVTLLQSEIHDVALSVHAIALTLPSPAKRIPKTRGRPHRGLLQTIQMSLAAAAGPPT
jgi:hypothetical protein